MNESKKYWYDYCRLNTSSNWFNIEQKRADMDKGTLCTYLAECLFVLSSFLENNVNFEEMNTYKLGLL